MLVYDDGVLNTIQSTPFVERILFCPIKGLNFPIVENSICMVSYVVSRVHAGENLKYLVTTCYMSKNVYLSTIVIFQH